MSIKVILQFLALANLDTESDQSNQNDWYSNGQSNDQGFGWTTAWAILRRRNAMVASKNIVQIVLLLDLEKFLEIFGSPVSVFPLIHEVGAFREIGVFSKAVELVCVIRVDCAANEMDHCCSESRTHRNILGILRRIDVTSDILIQLLCHATILFALC